MRATLIYGAGDIRVEDVPDPRIEQPTDAIVRITRSCICGSDLWPYQSKEATGQGDRIGHEFIGVVEETGSAVSQLRKGDLVVAPFFYGDGTCEFCKEGLTTSCPNGAPWGVKTDGGQGEAARVPFADACLTKLPVAGDSELLPSLLTLSDVFGTGHHAAVSAKVGPGSTVVVIGDGAVGLCGVLAAARLGAERIVIMGRHQDRTDLAVEFGATDVVAERGKEGEAKVVDLLGGGAPSVLECVGLEQSMKTAFGVVRQGGTIGRVGVPQTALPGTRAAFVGNITISGGIAPTQAYLPQLLPDVLEGKIQPGKVFDRTMDLASTPDGYRAMNEREALKVLLIP